jgi:hypothetical protein
MKTMHVGMVAAAVLSVAVPLTLTNCGDSNATTAADGGGGLQSGSGSGATSSGGGGTGSGSGGADSDAQSGSGSSGGSSSGVGPVGEGGSGGGTDGGTGTTTTTCQAPEGGASCDPGMVPCGSTMCDTSKTSCCLALGDAGVDTCVGPNGACTGTLVHCNETSDCENGLVCCDNYGATSCAATCGPYGYQICRSDSECGLQADAGAAKRCIVQTCGGAAPGGGPATPVVTIEACAVQEYAGPGGPGGPGGPATPPPWGAVYGCTAK